MAKTLALFIAIFLWTDGTAYAIPGFCTFSFQSEALARNAAAALNGKEDSAGATVLEYADAKFPWQVRINVPDVQLGKKLEKAAARFGGKLFECREMPPPGKPVIYLYPTQPQKVAVRLDYDGEISASYPSYNAALRGWSVFAYPDGKLINDEDRLEYSYLFWEGRPRREVSYDLSRGFIVKGSETQRFLQGSLRKLGLTPREYNEFIVYWLPKMQDNPFNLIHFAQEDYLRTAPLTITPVPDSLLRVFMVFQALDHPIPIQPQALPAFQRTGFAAVEWGGTEVGSSKTRPQATEFESD